MPGLDGTGPRGKGPRTGRGLGLCRGNVSSENSPLKGRGYGRGYGRGRGMRWRHRWGQRIEQE